MMQHSAGSIFSFEDAQRQAHEYAGRALNGEERDFLGELWAEVEAECEARLGSGSRPVPAGIG